jgi:CubicO group peptidase (beta-lactamase class C family)
VRQLLNQTSGLDTWSGWVPMADFDRSPAAAEKHACALATFELSRPVGSAFEYTNTNYDLLGLIVQAASGESYADYVRKHIFEPLEMRHSCTSCEEAAWHRLAMGHRYSFGYPVAAPATRSPRGLLASSELISCTEDLAHHLVAQLNGGRYRGVRILSPAGIAELQRPVVSAGKVLSVPLGDYAMGWFVVDRGATRIVWHDGVVPDFYAYVAMLPEQKKDIVLLVNADHFLMNVALTEVGAGAAALLAGAQPDPLRLGIIIIPWALRGLWLIPLLQMLGVTATLLRVHG